MAVRCRLPIPYHKAVRLALPSSLFVSGLAIFICGLVRTHYLGEVATKSPEEERYIQAQNEYMEWWNGFLLMACAVLAILAVVLDKQILFKLSVFAIGACFVFLIFGLLWDAGEFAWYSRNFHHISILEKEGFKCITNIHNFHYAGSPYSLRECNCKNGNRTSFDLFIYNSCELVRSQYYVHAFLGFSISCGIGLSLFTIFSFVLILKRISQITTALHLDEKPLSEDFCNLHGDLYVDQP